MCDHVTYLQNRITVIPPFIIFLSKSPLSHFPVGRFQKNIIIQSGWNVYAPHTHVPKRWKRVHYDL
jgi:hypothetical protein